MIERSLSEKAQAAQNEGFRQRVLTRLLRGHFAISQKLGLRDYDSLLPQADLLEPLRRQTTTQESEIETQERRDHQWREQIDRLMRMGFHEELGMTEEEYYNEISPIESQPLRFQGRFDIPILVDPRVNLRRQLEKHHVPINRNISPADLAKISLQELESKNAPARPYQIWIRQYNMHDPQSSSEMSKPFQWDERGLSAVEGLAVLREFPDLFDRVQWNSIALSESVITSQSGTGGQSVESQFALKRIGQLKQIAMDTEIFLPEYSHMSLLRKGRVGLK